MRLGEAIAICIFIIWVCLRLDHPWMIAVLFGTAWAGNVVGKYLSDWVFAKIQKLKQNENRPISEQRAETEDDYRSTT